MLHNDVKMSFKHSGEYFRDKNKRRVMHIVWITMVWCVGAARNKVLFRGEVANVNSLIISVKYTTWGWF